MTHRDGFPRLSARSAGRGDTRHRKPCATPSESLGKPPFRSGRRTGSGANRWGRRKASTMSRIARGFPSTRRIACPISMGHYQRSLVLSATLTREVTYRRFVNRRQVASYIGLAPSPYDSGDGRRSQGISKAGNSLVRYSLIQAAWLWLRHQPNSALTQWLHHRTEGQSKRVRCIMIVALARKMAIALWRYVELGLIPEGAVVK